MTYLFWAGVAMIVLATLGGWFPVWKSAELSPDSIKRRVYWVASAVASVMFFLSQLPDWRSGLFLGVGSAIALVVIAFNWTGHVKIRGRVFGAFLNPPPDRPPVLRRDELG
ncbi:hypothetical protein [Mycolicibacterium mengxianglii]|uniref:hypothetical protein n=1 Tax=Mycolicibacterium mengxianglii TaxID=2736649 RepID=UPI0018D100D1|nr:hypothetical protein [Mycolicibacterium mengxianglii]